MIKRGDRHGVRLKDRNSPVRKGFTGLKWFDIQEAYRVEARWVSHPQPKPVKVPNVLGQSESMPSPGYAEFTLNGKSVKLDGVMEDPQAEQLFFILQADAALRWKPCAAARPPGCAASEIRGIFSVCWPVWA